MTLVTVITPTYNRSRVLRRLYESLCRQTSQSFEWLVIDDGSTDETPQLLAAWTRHAPFPLRWVREANAGKHIALNAAYERIATPYVAMMDSDDWYTDDGLEVLVRHWDAIPGAQRHEFASVEGTTVYPDGTPTMARFPSDVFDCDALTMTTRYGLRGDTMGMFRTDVLISYPFPEYEGYVIEGLVWNRIAARYRTRFVNEVVAFKEYQPDGLSDWTAAKVISAARGFRQFNEELLWSPIRLPMAQRLRAYANFVRFSSHTRLSFRCQARSCPRRTLWLATAPVGIALAHRDRWRARP
jgi:glycosyltransferase involved in cell wall biosynthesis